MSRSGLANGRPWPACSKWRAMLGHSARSCPTPKEARLRGQRHSRSRDAAAISHHYDVSNDFYGLLLGPSITYSCAVWEWPSVGLEAAQEAKYELVSRWDRSGEGACGLWPLR